MEFRNISSKKTHKERMFSVAPQRLPDIGNTDSEIMNSKQQANDGKQTGPVIDEEEVHYDPLGVSDEMPSRTAKTEQEKRRRERIWDEWRAKSERRSTRVLERPRLNIGGVDINQQSTATRTVSRFWIIIALLPRGISFPRHCFTVKQWNEYGALDSLYLLSEGGPSFGITFC